MICRAATIRLPVLAAIVFTILAAQEPGSDNLIDRVIDRQNQLARKLGDIIFYGDFLYQELDKNGKAEKTIESKRRIYRKDVVKEYSEVVSMRRNGKELDPPSIQKEIDDLTKRGKRSGKTLMPYWEQCHDDYVYTVLGERTWNGIDAWAIAFTAREPSPGYINGTMVVSRDSLDLLEIEFKPSKVAAVIRKMDFKITYARNEGWWLPERFAMTLHLKVQVIVNLIEKRIVTEEHYSGYEFNQTLPDSLFDGKQGF